MPYNVTLAYFLWLISGCGALGFHRFYLKKPATGLIWMFTGGLGMVGSIYDFFTLSRQVNEANTWARMRVALDMESRDRYIPRYGTQGPGSEPFQKKETIEKTILRTAKNNIGYVTAAEVALEGDFGIDEAKEALEKLASKGFAEMRVRKSGVITFCFPEFMTEKNSAEFEDI